VERKRYFEIAGGSVIEIDAALDIVNDLKYLETTHIDKLGMLMLSCFKMLTGLMKAELKN
jgi:four helix bundle protein